MWEVHSLLDRKLFGGAHRGTHFPSLPTPEPTLRTCPRTWCRAEELPTTLPGERRKPSANATEFGVAPTCRASECFLSTENLRKTSLLLTQRVTPFDTLTTNGLPARTQTSSLVSGATYVVVHPCRTSTWGWYLSLCGSRKSAPSFFSCVHFVSAIHTQSWGPLSNGSAANLSHGDAGFEARGDAHAAVLGEGHHVALVRQDPDPRRAHGQTQVLELTHEQDHLESFKKIRVPLDSSWQENSSQTYHLGRCIGIKQQTDSVHNSARELWRTQAETSSRGPNNLCIYPLSTN